MNTGEHSFDGYISDEYGFMPERIIKRLPNEYDIWEQVVAKLPELLHGGTFETFSQMPVLGAATLDPIYLQRAATILGHFAQAWWRNLPEVTELPDSIKVPWQVVSDRLGRCGCFMSYADLMLANYELIDSTDPNPYRSENFRMLIAPFVNTSEQVFLMGITEMHVVGGRIIPLSMELLNANTDDQLFNSICSLKQVITDVQDSFHKISPNIHSATYCPPTEWALTIAKWYVPADFAIGGGVSGLTSPLFHLLDRIINRQDHNSYFGKEMKRFHKLHPIKWQKYLDENNWHTISDRVSKSNHRVQMAWNSLLEVYVGDHSLLDVHKAKVFGYIQIAAMVGRAQFTSGHKVNVAKNGWHKLTSNLEKAQNERPGGEYVSTKIESRKLIASSNLVREITLPVNLNGEPGDRVLIKIDDYKPRRYSITSQTANSTSLTIGRVKDGLYSNLLNAPDNTPLNIKVKLSLAPDFRLPKDSTPIVMYAGGTGISPFVGFVQRRRNSGSKSNTLYYSYRGPEMCWYNDFVQEQANSGYLKLHRIDTTTGVHINDIELDFTSDAIHYVCGRSSFARVVESKLKSELGSDKFYQLVANDRFRLDVFYSPVKLDLPRFTWTEIALHCTTSSMWVVINGNVYDITELYNIHPGGQQILRMKAGTDATTDFERITSHQGMAQQRMNDYCIGYVEWTDSPWLQILHTVMNHKVAAELRLESGNHDNDYFTKTTIPIINSMLDTEYPFRGDIWTWFEEIKQMALTKLDSIDSIE